MEFITNKEVDQIISNYPERAQQRLNQLRELIIDTAEKDDITKLVETTKWGEPSYISKKGSTIRMDWKARNPDKYYLYFICSTELVSTFKIIFGDELRFEKNRAIELNLNEPIPVSALKRCLSLALNYHKVKHLPLLGV